MSSITFQYAATLTLCEKHLGSPAVPNIPSFVLSGLLVNINPFSGHRQFH